MLERVIRHDLLGSYVRVEGVERALRRISTYLDSRWQKQFALDRGVRDLVTHEAAFAADFLEFFPCRLTWRAWCSEPPTGRTIKHAPGAPCYVAVPA